MSQFVDKLLSSLDSGVTQAVLLTNNNTDTRWFKAAARAADVTCFTTGRINFYKANGSRSQPTNGQVFFYFGENEEEFREEFSRYGVAGKLR